MRSKRRCACGRFVIGTRAYIHQLHYASMYIFAGKRISDRPFPVQHDFSFESSCSGGTIAYCQFSLTAVMQAADILIDVKCLETVCYELSQRLFPRPGPPLTPHEDPDVLECGTHPEPSNPLVPSPAVPGSPEDTDTQNVANSDYGSTETIQVWPHLHSPGSIPDVPSALLLCLRSTHPRSGIEPWESLLPVLVKHMLHTCRETCNQQTCCRKLHISGLPHCCQPLLCHVVLHI